MSMFSLSKGPSPPANDIPPAIEFVESCIHLFSKTADSGIRCAGTLRSIVLRVQSICAHFQKLITESEENHDWSMTISIASQIEYLEGLLTRISRNLHEEVEASFPSPCNDIQHCLYSIRAWHSNRQTFRDVSMKLQRRPFEIPRADWVIRSMNTSFFDDVSWMRTMNAAISEAFNSLASNIRNRLKKLTCVEEVLGRMSALPNFFETSSCHENSFIVIATHCAMITHGLISVLGNPTTPNHVQDLLRSPKTWVKILELLQKLRWAMTDSSVSHEGLTKDWIAYERYLLTSHDEMINDSLNQLISYPSKIRRPYRARSIALIKLCLAIGRHIKTIGPDDGLDKLKEVIRLTIMALDLATSAGKKVLWLDWNATCNSAAGLAIKEAETRIRALYVEYQMRTKDVDVELRKAQNEDKASIQLVKQYLDPSADLNCPETYMSDGMVYVDFLRIGSRMSQIEPTEISFNPATDLIALLTSAVLTQVSKDGRRRTYQSIKSEITEVCERINELILRSEIESNWSSCSRYMTMIVKLESCLLNVAEAASESIKAYLTSPPMSIKACLDLIDLWESNRALYQDLLSEFYGGVFEKDEWFPNQKIEASWDDFSWLRAVNDAACAIVGQMSYGDEVPTNLVIQLLLQIQSHLSPGRLHEGNKSAIMVMTIRCSMTVYGILSIAFDESTNMVIRDQMSSQEVWTKAYDMVQALWDNVVTSFSESVLGTAWAEYRKYLLNSEITVPDLTGHWIRLDDIPASGGGSSDVYKARLTSGSGTHGEQLVAVKVLRSIHIKPHSSPADTLKRRLIREIRIWSKLDHIHVAPLFGFALDGDMPCMIAPWYENGNVNNYVREHSTVPFRT